MIVSGSSGLVSSTISIRMSSSSTSGIGGGDAESAIISTRSEKAIDFAVAVPHTNIVVTNIPNSVLGHISEVMMRDEVVKVSFLHPSKSINIGNSEMSLINSGIMTESIQHIYDGTHSIRVRRL